MAKLSHHIVTLSAEQYNSLLGNAQVHTAKDEDGTLQYATVSIKDVPVSLLYNVDDGYYGAVVPRCMKSNKALKAIAQAA